MRAKVARIRNPALMVPRTGTRDLGFPGEAAAVRHRELQDAQAGSRRPHLHLEVPAIRHLAHAEPPQRIGADRPECAHIGKAHAVNETDRSANGAAGERLMRSDTGSGTRTDHEIVFVIEDRLHQARDRLGPIATVAIEEKKDLCSALYRRRSSFGTRPAVTTLSHDEHRCSGSARLCDSAVAAAAIDDDDLVDPAARHRREHRTDRPLLVEHRYDCGDARAAAVHRLQRTPHEAQAAGGLSLSNARRNSW